MPPPSPTRSADGNAAPVVLRERWALPRIALNLTLIQLALTLPGSLAVALRPDNAVEGYLALAAAAGLSAWQLRRGLTAGVVVEGRTVRRLGTRPSIPHDGGAALHWETGWFTDRGGNAVAVHRLKATAGGTRVELTRYPCVDTACQRFTDRLGQAGVRVPTPVGHRRIPS